MRLNCSVVFALIVCSFFNRLHFNRCNSFMLVFFWLVPLFGMEWKCFLFVSIDLCVFYFHIFMFVCLLAATNLSNSINYSSLLFELHPSVELTTWCKHMKCTLRLGLLSHTQEINDWKLSIHFHEMGWKKIISLLLAISHSRTLHTIIYSAV